MMKSVELKLKCGSEVRIVVAYQITKWTELETKIKTLFELDSSFVIKYRDADNDTISVSTQEELTKMLLAGGDCINALVCPKRSIPVSPNMNVVVPLEANESSAADFSDESVRQATKMTSNSDKISPIEIIQILRDITKFICTQDVLDHEYASRTKEKSLVTTTNIESWKEQQVCEWMSANHLQQYVDLFKANEIDGDALIHMDHDCLKSMGIESAARRIKILRQISSLKLAAGVDAPLSPLFELNELQI